MAPANDNFANAQVLNGVSGSLAANNILSTAEGGEPGNNGHTVWYKWTKPNNFPQKFVIFNTLPTDALPAPLLRTTLQAFTGTALNNLVEMPYYLGQRTNYAGNSLGSFIIVTAINSPIYIRVDGVSNVAINQREGNFNLAWATCTGVPSIGPCGGCTTEVGLKIVCVDTFKGPDLTTGDIRNGVAFAISRKTGTYPSGRYLLKYCSGYYERFAFYDSRTVDGVTNAPVFSQFISSPGTTPPQIPLIFFNNVINANWTLSPNRGLFNAFPGDFDNGFNGVSWWDGTQILTGNNPPGIFNPINNPLSGVHSFLTVSFYDQADLRQVNNCSAIGFHHTGGTMAFVLAIGISSTVHFPPSGNFFNVDITPYIDPYADISHEPNTFPPGMFVGPEGPSTFSLLRILPDITLGTVTNIFDNSSNNLSPNGQKNARLTVPLINNSQVPWNGVSIVAAGFFTTQDPAFYLPNPQTLNLVQAGTTNYAESFVMTNPVGTFTLALTDSESNPYPALTINVTPLFSAALSFQINFNGAFPIVAGKPANRFNFIFRNIGNGTTLAVIGTITATVGGQAIQIAGSDGIYRNAITIQPDFGLGPGVGWKTQQASIDLFVAHIAAAQNVKFNFAFTDTGNVFPPSAITINSP